MANSSILRPWFSIFLILAFVGNAALSAFLFLQQHEYEDAHRDIPKLLREKSQIGSDLDNLTKRHAALKGEADAYQAHLDKDREQVAESKRWKADADEYKKQRDTIMQACRDLQVVNSSLEQTKHTLSDSVKTLQAEKGSLEASLKDTIEKRDTAERKWKGIEARIEAGSQEEATLTPILKSKRDQVDSLTRERDKLDKAVTDLSSKQNELNKTVDDLTAKLQARNLAERETIELQAKKTVLTSLVQAMKTAHEDASGNLDSLRKEIGESSATATRLRADVLRLRQEKSELEKGPPNPPQKKD